jgi:peptide deformylase
MPTRNYPGLKKDPLDFDRTLLYNEAEQFDFKDSSVDPWELAEDMIKFMREYKGYGLAANQIGLPYKMFVTEGDPAFAVFNPRITYRSPNDIRLDEGCLSFPNLILNIKRPASIRVRFQDPNGDFVVKQFAGMSARIFQHEFDHLEGVDYTTRVSKLKYKMAVKKMQKQAKRGKIRVINYGVERKK